MVMVLYKLQNFLQFTPSILYYKMFKLKQIKLLTELSNCYSIVSSQEILVGVDKYHPRYCSINRICTPTKLDINNSAIIKKYPKNTNH
jgi:hypothetical protein